MGEETIRFVHPPFNVRPTRVEGDRLAPESVLTGMATVRLLDHVLPVIQTLDGMINRKILEQACRQRNIDVTAEDIEKLLSAVEQTGKAEVVADAEPGACDGQAARRLPDRCVRGEHVPRSERHGRAGAAHCRHRWVSD